MKIYFTNPTPLDLQSALIFGVSAKDTTSPIGQFGTGLKYAIAIVLRLGGQISIKSEGYNVHFFTQKQTVRGQTFEAVFYRDIASACPDVSCNFTTHLGSHWEAWMAYRELACNALDEGGTVSAEASSATTVVTINCPAFDYIWPLRGDILLHQRNLGQLINESEVCDIYLGNSNSIFYRGVAIHRLKRPSLFTYNIKSHLLLTEDRTPLWPWSVPEAISEGTQSISDETLRIKLLTVDKSFYEEDLGFSGTLHQSFADTAAKLLKQGQRINRSVELHLRQLSKTADITVPLELSAVQQKKFDRAKVALRAIDIDLDKFPIHFVESLGQGVYGHAIDQQIYIADFAFEQGTKMLASTLLEEWVHCNFGCADFDRAMQNWLFDKILTLVEQISAEPL